MAFIFCRSCEWNQDDFRTMHYNFWNYHFGHGGFAWGLICPRIVRGDAPCGPMFSWFAILRSMYHFLRSTWRMKWRTEKAFQESYRGPEKWPLCPKCGNNSLAAD